MVRSWRLVVGLAAIGFWSSHCSSMAEGSGSGGAPDAGPVINADAGTPADAGSGDAGGITGADAGATPDGGGSVDAGSGGGGGGGSVDAGSGGGGSVDAGSGGGGGALDGGSAGGSADAGSGGGSADGGAGGGVAAGCEGVVPDRLGSSFTFEVPGFTFPGADWKCDSDTSDESGNVASHVVYGAMYTSQRWHFFDSNGAHRADFYALDLFPEGEGFAGIFEVPTDQVPLFKVGLWAPDGRRTDGPTVGGEIVPSGVRAWPNGILTLNTFCSASGDRQSITLRRFDPALKESARVSLISNCVGVAGVVEDANGNRLILVHGAAADGFGNDDLLGSWFDFGGKALTGWFRVASGAGRVDLAHALIGGGAVARIDGAWRYFIPSGKAEVQPAPAFLRDNPQTDFTLVRGAKAYAVLPRSGDRTQMKLYSTSGDLCGTVRFPNGSLTTGADGSVIAASGDRGCTKTVWPGLLH